MIKLLIVSEMFIASINGEEMMNLRGSIQLKSSYKWHTN